VCIANEQYYYVIQTTVYLFSLKAEVSGMRGSVPSESRRLIDALRFAGVAMVAVLACSRFSLAIYQHGLKKS
jgi:hypothetical protein